MAASSSNSQSVPVASTRSDHDSARKFNIVIFGLPECFKGTRKTEREKSDLDNSTKVLTDLDNSIQPYSIRDTIRLGKYNHTGHPRPLLVTLNRSSDVTTILSRRVQVKPSYVIKADLSKEARAVESHLLKARWSLIQAKTSKSDIKIRGNKLYVNGKVYGQADKSGFTPTQTSQTSDSTLSTALPKVTTPMDTSNVPTTSA